ncbi:MAG: hypothetical protein NTX24_00140 [Candidatus Pacearchaeota archaeon]|nr:hypothetical protein [Candidatus Pacearchaeota archaeon]
MKKIIIILVFVLLFSLNIISIAKSDGCKITIQGANVVIEKDTSIDSDSIVKISLGESYSINQPITSNGFMKSGEKNAVGKIFWKKENVGKAFTITATIGPKGWLGQDRMVCSIGYVPVAGDVQEITTAICKIDNGKLVIDLNGRSAYEKDYQFKITAKTPGSIGEIPLGDYLFPKFQQREEYVLPFNLKSGVEYTITAANYHNNWPFGYVITKICETKYVFSGTETPIPSTTGTVNAGNTAAPNNRNGGNNKVSAPTSDPDGDYMDGKITYAQWKQAKGI